MPNIFDGLNKMNDEKLKYQIATLETVTIANIASEMGQKTKKSSIKVTNAIMSVFGNKRIEEPKVVSIEERITIAKASLDKLNKVEL